MVGLACQLELLVLLVHLDVAAAGYAAGTHTTSNNGCVGGHTATNGQDTLRYLHTCDILRRSLQTNQNYLLALSSPLLSVVCCEHDLTASSSRRSAQTLAYRCSSLQSLSVELRVEQCVEVSRIDHQNSFLLGLVAFVNEVASDLQSSLSGSLTVTALEHVELLVLYGKLHILHVVIVVLEGVANLDELCVSLGELLLHLSDGHRSTNTSNNVLALSVDKELAHELLLAGSRITCERNAGTGLVVQVAEYHRHYVYCGTPAVRDIVVAAVYVCTGVVPRTEYSLDSELELLNRIGREVLAELLLVLSLELLCKSLEVSSGQVDIVLNALLRLHLVDELLEVLLTYFHNYIREHLNEASVGVVNESLKLRIGVACDHSVNNVVVKTEVKNGIHHTGHGCACAGTYGNEERILEIAELLAVDLLHLLNAFHSLSHDLVVDLSAIFVVLSASLSSDGEALGYGQTDAGHLGKVCALTAEEITHGHVAFAEHVDPLVCHWYIPPEFV